LLPLRGEGLDASAAIDLLKQLLEDQDLYEGNRDKLKAQLAQF
jgi:hypothetical protein